ncbi:adeC/adeK/oprM family multidrug efflux complex outer membrane factor [Desulfuromonas versatilis]|uniref:AdeC/adeK/oprM family multidrug efflux complex outer membrane factor n=1 Tax=Desulfuromonas versatilis TaxID=2802975 RepID=A0ABM8HZP8_9BACT|nr:efflux transporter outer membrane subunit [Desulfuromonas versatilis]BCR06284.1 adeC/adeK/oprM family multidrug efflux complex outer membrane factor [Desulfuromonas versatilis]
MNNRYKKLAAAIALFALSGCAMAPQYQRPEMPVADTFAERNISAAPSAEEGVPTKSVATLGWRDVFIDPALQQLIETALLNNRDLRETALNVASYQAQYRIQRSALLPSVDGSGYGTKQRSLTGTSLSTSEAYSLEIGATAYELDFYGRIRSLKDQALEQYLAMEETQKSAQISLIAEVSTAYFTWLADRELLQISEDTRKVEEGSYELIVQRVDAGIANELDLAQARTSLETVKANLAMYRRLVAEDLHYLTFLVGTSLPDRLQEAKGLLSSVAPLSIIPEDLSSEVLLQRPDIMAAEHELKGANANIGAARAAFFPTISLTASAGVISTDLSNLFDGGSGAWAFTPSLSVPIFNSGKLRAELDVAEVQKEIYVSRYENAIQRAFQEVADSLVGIKTYEEQVVAQKANLAANEQYFNLARNRYQEGVDSFLTLLDAQRSLYSSKQAYLSLTLAQLENQVDLYKVLGGGVKEYTE